MSDSANSIPKYVHVKVPKAVSENKDTKETEPEDKSVVEVSHLPVSYLSSIPQIDTSIDRAAPRDLLRTYARVNAANPGNIVDQALHTIYSTAGDQSLYGSSTTSLLGVENRLLMSWDNPSAGTAQYTKSYTVGFKITTSTEVSANISLAPSFEGISLGSASMGIKTVTTKETQESSTETVNVTVPPNSSVYFYQRRYYLSTDIYFTLDAWGELSIAGSEGGYHVQRATILSYIDATDYLTTSTRLSNTTFEYFSSENWSGWFGKHVRQFGNLTTRAKGKLRSMGINGSQRG